MLLERLKLGLTQLPFLPTRGDEASLQVQLFILTAFILNLTHKRVSKT
jgi:hypothetical protein